MVLTKKQFNAVVVVEGKDDTTRLKQFFPGIETIETNGSDVPEPVLIELAELAKKRPIIILTDPDLNGERIRRLVTAAVPDAKQAFITRKEGEPHKRGNSLGVEHASRAALIKALSELHEAQALPSDLTIGDYQRLGLSSGQGARKLREQVGIKLRIGYGNAKQFYKRLQTFGVTLNDLEQAVQEVKHE
ncbi:ribonuclease M5 [Lactobacillus xylocopicola]|uniref:Ribonuclease M5 n=1 Tax=Lactobacillus xylocopicola TaxID=2976676 RepID=A0ABN6SPN2_9LACO|nr:ribonuclease M5 [Lactobacillus xylocopicola]BDR61007.1 ribonuclease M5 [Lactobacillus xylocopicola]